MSLEDSLKRRGASATNPEAKENSLGKEAEMVRVPSGVYRPELDEQNLPKMSAPAIIDKVLRDRRKKNAEKRVRYGTKVSNRPAPMRQNYDSKATPQTQENIRRMLGEKEE